ncbi:MAG: hypothetical protein R3240_06120 [Gammaproteobacteria bacterium]|nr:hypothetical protein [Gammaproteobacteria bacterium]
MESLTLILILSLVYSFTAALSGAGKSSAVASKAGSSRFVDTTASENNILFRNLQIGYIDQEEDRESLIPPRQFEIILFNTLSRSNYVNLQQGDFVVDVEIEGISSVELSEQPAVSIRYNVYDTVEKLLISEKRISTPIKTKLTNAQLLDKQNKSSKKQISSAIETNVKEFVASLTEIDKQY